MLTGWFSERNDSSKHFFEYIRSKPSDAAKACQKETVEVCLCYAERGSGGRGEGSTWTVIKACTRGHEI